MSRHAASFVLGYHGCDQEVGLKALVQGVALSPSEKDYDWLGPGVYFWEADPQRALEWAEEKAERDGRTKPFVIGATIDLGNCLDLLQRQNIEILTAAYENLKTIVTKAQTELPRNKNLKNKGGGDKILRFFGLRRHPAAPCGHRKAQCHVSGYRRFQTVRYGAGIVHRRRSCLRRRGILCEDPYANRGQS